MEIDKLFTLWNLIVGLAFLFAVAFNLYRYRSLEKRRRLFQRLALELGLTEDGPQEFPEEKITGIPATSRQGKIIKKAIIFVMQTFGLRVSLARSELLEVLSNFRLFKGFKSIRIDNLIIKDSNSAKIYLFEGSWKTKSNRTYNRTGFVVMDERLDFPELTVVPEDLAKKAVKLLGPLGLADEDIKIEFDPEFSASYFVSGAEEYKVREILNAGACRWFMTHKQKGPHFESSGSAFAIYVEKKNLEMDKVRAFYLSCNEFFEMWAR